MPPVDAPKLFRALGEAGLLPLFSHPDKAIALQVAEALNEAGFPVLELTHRSENALEVFKHLDDAFGHREHPLILGAGSVVDAATAAQYIEAGASFIVGPGYVDEVATACRQRSTPYIPGAFTPTEAIAADKAGARLVKLFPASVLGPGFLKALKGPCPWLRLMPTGGVKMDEGSVRAWFEAGALCLGAGSELIAKELVEAEDWSTLKARGREALALAAKWKPKTTKWSGVWGF